MKRILIVICAVAAVLILMVTNSIADFSRADPNKSVNFGSEFLMKPTWGAFYNSSIKEVKNEK